MDTKNAIAALAALAQESRLAIFRLLVEVGPDGQVALILMFGTISGAHFNPAVTLARAASNTFAGIRPGDAPGFMIAQLLGAAAATGVFCWLYPAAPPDATVAGTVAPSEFAHPQSNTEKA